MLKNSMYKQQTISYYTSLYEELIPKDNFFRQLKENINFSFVNKMLKESYSETMGRPADEPEKLFKLLFIQRLKGFSDREVIKEAKYNMEYKYFLDLNPEDNLVDPSLLSVFRRTRINNEDLLEKILIEILRQAIDKGILKSNAIIMDATHTKANASKESNSDQLRRLTKNLRKIVYQTTYEASEKFPEKPAINADLKTEVAYSKQLIEVLDDIDNLHDRAKKEAQKVKDFLNNIPENTAQSSIDPDAKTGYKSRDNSFFGYKTHVGMTDERIIAAVEVTSGEASDGKQLQKLVKKAQNAGIKVEEVLADCAYGGKDNLEFLKEKEIKAYMKLNPLVTENQRKVDLGMSYNKDAGTMQCRGGHLAVKSRLHQNKGCNRNPRMIYFFDVEKCKECPYKTGCYKDGAKTKSYCEIEKCETHSEHMAFQETEEFKTRMRQRYMIEAKNGEMKTSHGLGVCIYRGLFGMQLQSYLTAITVNIKRIMKLMLINKAEIA